MKLLQNCDLCRHDLFDVQMINLVNLTKAYLNYFTDTQKIISQLKKMKTTDIILLILGQK